MAKVWNCEVEDGINGLIPVALEKPWLSEIVFCLIVIGVRRRKQNKPELMSTLTCLHLETYISRRELCCHSKFVACIADIGNKCS